jgi:homoprotocatechuate degradation regulator HpaR
MARLPRTLPFRRSLAGTLLVAREATLIHMRPALRKANLTEPQWRVMRVLEVENDCEPVQLVELSLIQAPSVTRIMKELTETGLITRIFNKTNSRRSVLALTAAGRTLLQQITEETDKLLVPHIERFGRTRLEALMAELRALTITLYSPLDRDG